MDRRKRDAVQQFDALYGMSNAELLSELEITMSHADTETFDPDYVEACLRILQDRDPVMEDFNPQQELQSLPLDPRRAGMMTRRRHQRLKVLRALEIAAVLVVLLAVMAGAGGYNLMDWLRSINADTVSFGVEPSGELEFLHADAQPQEGEFASLQEALDAYGVTEPASPTWIPEDYRIVSAEATVEEGEMYLFDSVYETDDDKRMTIDFMCFPSGNAKMTSEIEPEGEIYEYHGITYYLFRNLERNKCHWTQNGFICTISGHVTFDELKQMIRSMDPE